jgi:hypothetical protein
LTAFIFSDLNYKPVIFLSQTENTPKHFFSKKSTDNNNNNNNNTEGDVTVLWYQAAHTDREVTANRPDIIIEIKKEKTCTPIDVAITSDRNVVQKEAEKKLKYKFKYRVTENVEPEM